MQPRVYLLFILFVVLAAFYASVTRESVPEMAAKQHAQTEMFNQLDEIAVKQGEEVTTSGN